VLNKLCFTDFWGTDIHVHSIRMIKRIINFVTVNIRRLKYVSYMSESIYLECFLKRHFIVIIVLLLVITYITNSDRLNSLCTVIMFLF